MVGRPSRCFGGGREAFPEVQKWPGVPPGGPGVLGWSSWKSGSGWKALPEGWERSEGISGGSGVVGNGLVAIPKDREWSGGPPGGLGVIRNGLQAFPKDQ